MKAQYWKLTVKLSFALRVIPGSLYSHKKSNQGILDVHYKVVVNAGAYGVPVSGSPLKGASFLRQKMADGRHSSVFQIK